MISMMQPSSIGSSVSRGTNTSSLLCLYNRTLSNRSPYGCSGNYKVTKSVLNNEEDNVIVDRELF